MNELTREPMVQIAQVGIDLSKRLYQVHAIDAAGRVIKQRAMSPGPILRLVRRPQGRLHGGDGGVRRRAPRGAAADPYSYSRSHAGRSLMPCSTRQTSM